MSLVQSGGVSPRLPSAYQEVEYIQSSGTQWIDTLYNAKLTTKFEFKMKYTTLADSKYLFGNQYDASGLATAIFVGGGSPPPAIYRCFGNVYDFTATGVSSTTNDLEITFDVQNKSLIINGITISMSSATATNNANTSCLIFSASDSRSAYPASTRCSSSRCYYFNIYENNVLVRQFVPCYRKSDNEAGLYDLVNDVFYTNQGSGSFTCGVPIIYDSRYQQVEYIESSGTQYINSHYACNGNTKVEVDCYSIIKTDFNMMGITGYETNGRCCFGLYGSAGTTASQYYGFAGSNIQESAIAEQRLTWVLDLKNKTYSNGVSSGTYTGSNYTNSKNVPFFFFVRADESNGNIIPQSTSVGYGWFKLYGARFYENGNIVRCYIPVYRIADNEIGLLDIVNDVFYTNQGSGVFTKGGNL